MRARVVLLRMHENGIIQLPPPRNSNGNRSRSRSKATGQKKNRKEPSEFPSQGREAALFAEDEPAITRPSIKYNLPEGWVEKEATHDARGKFFDHEGGTASR